MNLDNFDAYFNQMVNVIATIQTVRSQMNSVNVSVDLINSQYSTAFDMTNDTQLEALYVGGVSVLAGAVANLQALIP